MKFVAVYKQIHALKKKFLPFIILVKISGLFFTVYVQNSALSPSSLCRSGSRQAEVADPLILVCESIP